MKLRLLLGSCLLALFASFDYPNEPSVLVCGGPPATSQFTTDVGLAGAATGTTEAAVVAAAIKQMLDRLASCPGCTVEGEVGCNRDYTLEDKDGALVDLHDDEGGGFRLDTTAHSTNFWSAGIDLNRGDVLTITCTKCVTPLPDPE